MAYGLVRRRGDVFVQATNLYGDSVVEKKVRRYVPVGFIDWIRKPAEDEVATGNNHRVFLRVMRDGGATDCLMEVDVPAHPYQVMGVAGQKRWRASLTWEETVAIPL